MSCCGHRKSVTHEVGQPLPELNTPIQTCEQEPVIPQVPVSNFPVCDPSEFHPRQGANLPDFLTDPRDAREKDSVILLARIGKRLARFVGSGFLVIENGCAKLKEHVPISVRNLWHRRKDASYKGSSSLGEPLDSPHDVIADQFGKLYAIKGLEDSNSVRVWNKTTRMMETWPLADLPLSIARKLTESHGLQLVGYRPLGMGESWCGERPLENLVGEGLVFIRRVAAPPADCSECPSCDDNFQYVAEPLAPPVIPEGSTDVYTLAFSSAQGLFWQLQEPSDE